MSWLDAQHLMDMNRVGRFQIPRVGCLFEWQGIPKAPHAFAHAVWAGDRKSFSGGMILHGKHLTKTWTKQQSIVATSAAEAELYAGNRAATEWMEVQAFAKDLCGSVPIRLHTDSGAALSIITMARLGKANDIEIQHLWLQEPVHNGMLTVEKIPPRRTLRPWEQKHVTSERSEMSLRLVTWFYVEARYFMSRGKPPASRFGNA